MSKFKSRFLTFLIFTAIITAAFATFVQAAPTAKALQVVFGKFKVNYNSKDVTSQVSPIIVNNSTYLPLRSMANLLNKNISVDAATNTILLTDKADPNAANLSNQIATLNSQVSNLNSQIATKDAYIMTLANRIKVLEADLAAKNEDNDSGNIDDLEDTLNDDYDTYEGANFDISLSGDEDDITVEIDTDKDDWDDIDSDDQEDFLQDIVDYILSEFEDADIEGEVTDGSSTLVEFTVNSDGEIEIESDADLEDLQDALNEVLIDNDFGVLEGIACDDLEIELDGDTDELTFIVNIDLDDYADEWEALDDNEIEEFMLNIYDYIVDDEDDYGFGDADIAGYFYDIDSEEDLAKIYNDGDTFKRY